MLDLIPGLRVSTGAVYFSSNKSGQMPSVGLTVRTLLLLTMAAVPTPTVCAEKVKVHGYLDFRKPAFLIVDGQRITVTNDTRFAGKGAASAGAVPLGYDIEVKGKRRSDGTIVARTLKAKPNGIERFESDALMAANMAEGQYIADNEVYEEGSHGHRKKIGTLIMTGPEAERARRIVDRLLPPYIDPNQVRVYVVDSDDWSAFAMANSSIYVYRGLMNDLDDDELAIVLGHELAHAIYEHGRRHATKGDFVAGMAEAALVGADGIDDRYARTAAEVAVMIGLGSVFNTFSREFESQADRVGLRYAYEAGFDFSKAPALWGRFAAKYGDHGTAANFFFGDHPTQVRRAANLTREIRHNYADPGLDPPGSATAAR